MPRTKRAKVISLTKTKSKGRDAKTAQIDAIRSALEEYKNVFGLRYTNMRLSEHFRDIRMHFKESRLYLGKNSVSQVALGRSVEEEVKDNLHNVSKLLEGDAGLLFTNRDKDEVISYFAAFEKEDYAKSGSIATETIVLEPGELPQFSPSVLDHIRKLGLVVEVEDGKVVLKSGFVAATEGEPLSAEQAKVLKQLKKALGVFRIDLTCYWTDGEFEEL